MSSMDNNIFTTKLYDIVFPPEDEPFDKLFLVMEHVELSLKSMFGDVTEGFNSQHLIVILYNLLCALNFVHTCGIMHRDIKPANILLTPQCVVKICDFGLARTELQKNEEEDKESNGIVTRETRMPGEKKDKPKVRLHLSPAVQTRWYRSPEVMIVEPKYSS